MVTDGKTLKHQWLVLTFLPFIVGCTTLMPLINATEATEAIDVATMDNVTDQPVDGTELDTESGVTPSSPDASATDDKSTCEPIVGVSDSALDNPVVTDKEAAMTTVYADIASVSEQAVLRCLIENKEVFEAYDAVYNGLALFESELINGLLTSLEQDKAITRLQLLLLEKEAQLQQLIIEQQSTIQEMVRTQAKLHNRNSRAETAALLAEVTLTYKKAELIATESQNPTVDRAKQLLSQANDAFRNDNYDSSAFLARQSLTSLQVLLLQNTQQSTQKSEQRVDQLFAIPLTMKAVVNANIRTTPSNTSPIIHTIARGETVTAIGYKGVWVQVVLTDEAALNGWIFHALLTLSTPTVDTQ